ncbi:MAG TPA: hypothetical protein VGI64_04010 [Streptosporangiaceae bacterium]
MTSSRPPAGTRRAQQRHAASGDGGQGAERPRQGGPADRDPQPPSRPAGPDHGKRGASTPAASTPAAGPAATGPAGAGQAGAGQEGAGQAGAGQEGAGQEAGSTPADQPAASAAATGRDRRRLPPVRLAPREELAAAARVAPLMRAARDLARWAGRAARGPAGTDLSAGQAAAAAAALDLDTREVDAAWQVAVATGMAGRSAGGGSRRGFVLASSDPEELLAAWDLALAALLAAEDLDGLATALYTTGAPVRMDGLFDAYAAAAGTRRSRNERESARQGSEDGAALSHALETLADLGVVELGTDDSAGGLTVELSPLGIWGVHRRLRAQGWHVPVLGIADRPGAEGLLVTLASCDAEDGEAEIGGWLAARAADQAAAELIQAAASGSPGLRGAAFAVLDRIGHDAAGQVRSALADPVLRAHAAVWLHEHGEDAELRPEDRTWLLVDLGAGLLEEADPRDVVAELLPDVPADAQAEIVAGLWRVSHPGVTDLLTALSDHHPDPAVARAARKASFKARSPAASDPAPGP